MEHTYVIYMTLFGNLYVHVQKRASDKIHYFFQFQYIDI